MPWRVEILDRRVERELDELAADIRQRFLRIAELIERHGPAGVHEPYVKHPDGKLWEMRMKGKDGIARAIYLTAKGERVVVRLRQEDTEDPAQGPGDRARTRERGDVMGIPLNKVAKRWMKEPGFKEGYDALDEEFALASQLIEARSRAGLTQAEVADRMGTSQSTVARLESGGAKPSLSTLKRFAQATGARVRITLEAKPRSKKQRGTRAA